MGHLQGTSTFHTPELMNVTSFGAKVMADVIKNLKTRTSWTLWVGLKSSDICPCKRYTEEKHSAEVHVTMGAEMGVMWPQAKDYLVPPEAGRGKEVFSSRAFRGGVGLACTWISDFWPL